MIKSNELNIEVSEFINKLNHPQIDQIQWLRNLILSSSFNVNENIKWNGPNYSINNKDRITLRVQSPKMIQMILHCGAKPQDNLKSNAIENNSNLLEWKSKDRAVITIMPNGNYHEKEISQIIQQWLEKTNQLN